MTWSRCCKSTCNFLSGGQIFVSPFEKENREKDRTIVSEGSVYRNGSAKVESMSNQMNADEDCPIPEHVTYSAHSLVHRAIVRMDPTLLEKIEGFEKMISGHKYTPDNSNVRIILSGRDWSEKRLFIYGNQSTKEARKFVDEVIEKVRDVNHDCELISSIEITNIAVNGDFGIQLNLPELFEDLEADGIGIEYEPEQFPALIVRINEPSVTFLLFSTGKFAIQGLDTFEDIRPAIQRIWSNLNNCQSDRNSMAGG